MLDFWQNLPGEINPVLFEWGIFSVRWYWLMYLVGFFVVYRLLVYRLKKGEFTPEFAGQKSVSAVKGVAKKPLPVAVKLLKSNQELLLDLLFWTFLGMLIGARLGYFFFYDLETFLAQPLKYLIPFENTAEGFKVTGFYGMSFHGGLLGGGLAFYLFTRVKKLDFFKVVDFFIPALPAGYFFGRLGNFLNGELYGRVTEKFIGMYFPAAYYRDSALLLRHPSQLYEALGEGILLFLLLWPLRNKQFVKANPGILGVIFLAGYGLIRFLIEFTREPDAHLGLVLGGLTAGQVLSIIMIIVSLLFLLKIKIKQHAA